MRIGTNLRKIGIVGVAFGSLIALAQPFGLNERLVRTATSRLAKDGWLEGRRAGKLSEYHLSDDGRERFADATQRIYSAPDTEWSGRWTVIVLPPMPAAQRKSLRDELLWRGFGPLSNNVFAHPELDSSALQLSRRPGAPLSKVIVFDASLGDDDAPQRLVSLGWDLEDLGRRYQQFVKRFEIEETVERSFITRQRESQTRGCGKQKRVVFVLEIGAQSTLSLLSHATQDVIEVFDDQ